jgi:hypothetical protein
MTQKIYLVLSNVKLDSTKGVGPHENGITFKGTYFPDDEGKYTDLIAAKVMRMIDAETVEDAQAIVAKEVEAAKPVANVKEASTRTAAPAPAVVPAAAKVAPQEPAQAAAPAVVDPAAPGTNVPVVGGGDQAPVEDAAATL